jgi:tRNA threonylcarbamoyladenosine biosynthesis protein TsaB
MPLLLAFDLSTPRGSVAIGDSERVLAQRELLSERRQAIELVPSIESLLREVDRVPRDLSGIVVGRGPGSFTGVRVAAATARGMASALGLPLSAPSSLAAGAVSCGGNLAENPRYILFDARGDRVYAACYRITDGHQAGGQSEEMRFEILVGPSATTVQEVIASAVPAGARFGGDGAVRHSESLRSAGYEVLASPLGMPTAGGLLHLVRTAVCLPEEQGSLWEPDYIRGSSAIPLSER